MAKKIQIVKPTQLQVPDQQIKKITYSTFIGTKLMTFDSNKGLKQYEMFENDKNLVEYLKEYTD